MPGSKAGCSSESGREVVGEIEVQMRVTRHFRLVGALCGVISPATVGKYAWLTRAVDALSDSMGLEVL
jgi:hypothetical protein